MRFDYIFENCLLKVHSFTTKLEIALHSVNGGVCYILNKVHSKLQMSNYVFLFLAPASRNEYQTIKQQLEVEKIPGLEPGDPPRSFHSLTNVERAQMEKKRLAGFLNEFYFCSYRYFSYDVTCIVQLGFFLFFKIFV